MAHRIITQIAITGARVFGRAFTEAYKQANARRVAPGASGSSGGGGGGGVVGGGTSSLTLDEACRILNLSPPKSRPSGPATTTNESFNTSATPTASETSKELANIAERFKKLFDQNDPNKGGSFYLQSKVLRARERMEAEVGKRVDREAEAAEMKERPRVYRER